MLVEARRRREVRRRSDRPLQRADGLLGLVDPGRVLRQPQGHELGKQLVEVAAEGRLLGDLAQRRDGDDVAHARAGSATGAPRSSTHEPGAVAVRVLERAEVARERRSAARPRARRVREAPSGGERRGRGQRCARGRRSATPRQDRAVYGRVRAAAATPSRCSRRSAVSYDRVGAVLSFGQDPRWRRALVARVPNDGGSVLDVATGTGLVAERLLARGHAVTGLDQSPDMLAAARRRFGGRVQLVEASARRSPSPTRRSTTSRSRTCSATSTTRARRSRELARVVRPGGTSRSLEFCVPRGRLAAAVGALRRRRTARRRTR